MKVLCCLAIASLWIFSASAQFYGGVGLTDFGSHFSGIRPMNGIGVTYNVRYNFLERSKMSLSLSLPITLGVSGDPAIFSNLEENQADGVSLDLPLLCNISFGAGSVKRDQEDVWGFFTGFGPGVHYVNGQVGVVHNNPGPNTISYSGDDPLSKTMAGPAFDIGFRLGLGHRRRRSLEFRYLLLLGAAASGESVSSGTVQFNF